MQFFISLKIVVHVPVFIAASWIQYTELAQPFSDMVLDMHGFKQNVKTIPLNDSIQKYNNNCRAR